MLGKQPTEREVYVHFMAWQHVLVIVLCHFPSHAHASHRVCCNRGRVESWRGFVTTGARRRVCDVLLSCYLYIWSAIWLPQLVAGTLGHCCSARGLLVLCAGHGAARRQAPTGEYSLFTRVICATALSISLLLQFCYGGKLGNRQILGFYFLWHSG